MAKIVVLASGDDADTAKTALEGAGLDFEVVEPSPANLLHIVIGMVGGDEESKEEKEEKKEPKGDAPAEEPAPEEEVPAEEPAPEEEVQEALGVIVLNGELVKAVKSNLAESVLHVVDLVSGPKTSYTLNEGVFSFWPADVANPTQRVLVENNGQMVSLEIAVRKSGTKDAYITIGADLAPLISK